MSEANYGHINWREQARTVGGAELVAVVEAIAEDVHEIKLAVQSLRTAFPAGDLEGHRRYHDVMIAQLEEKRKLRIAVQEKTISGLIWLGIVMVGTAVWHELTRLFIK